MARRSERERVAVFGVAAYIEGFILPVEYRQVNSFAKARAVEKRLAQMVGITRTVIRSRKTGRVWATQWPFCSENNTQSAGRL